MYCRFIDQVYGFMISRGFRGGHFSQGFIFFFSVGGLVVFNREAWFDLPSFFAFLLAVEAHPFVFEGFSLGLVDIDCRLVNQVRGFIVFKRLRRRHVM